MKGGRQGVVVQTGGGTTPEPLAHFKPIHFTGGSATDGASVKGPIDDTAWTHTQLDMVDGSAKTMAASGALNAAGSGFAVTWKSAT